MDRNHRRSYGTILGNIADNDDIAMRTDIPVLDTQDPAFFVVNDSHRNTIMMHPILLAIAFTIILTSCDAQTGGRATSSGAAGGHVGGPCEGCEAIYEYGTMPLFPVDTLPSYTDNEPKLVVTGTIFERDGITPAPGVILYIYHTDRRGRYARTGNETGWAKRHGFIRGWIRTGADGRYTFHTFRPAAYSDGTEPEHIHAVVKEPDINEYYIDDFMFDDDSLLTQSRSGRLPKRGGSGVVHPHVENGILTIRRDIVLGLNIPDYR